MNGFQRELNKQRAEEIAIYLKQGNGSIPTNIVLSSQDEIGVTYNARNKTISYQRLARGFLALDGQHRLWGYQICYEKYGLDHRVPVSIYVGLTRADEAKLFIDINTKQVGVPAALLLDIQHTAKMEGERDSILRSLFDRLNQDASLQISAKLSPSRSVNGKISRVSFNRAVGIALDSPVLRDSDSDKRYILLSNYIQAFERELDKISLLTRSAFFEAIFEIFEDSIRQSILSFKNAKMESIRKIIRPVAQYEYSPAMLANTGTLKKAVKAALTGSVSISADML
jgi:DGQHR domain-containing protein